MAITCGWASIDERGKARGGKAGDQTGREVKTGAWYDFGQTEVLRWKDKAKADTFASIIRYWCNNPHVGYDQGARTTLGQWCKTHKWGYKVDVNVETDCSRMVADGVNCTMKKEVIGLGATFYTGNLADVLMKTGLFERLAGSKYTDSDAYLMEGDIINNPAKHVIVALENGAKIIEKKAAPKKKSVTTIAQEVIDGKWGNDPQRSMKLKKAGYNPKEVQKKVNSMLGKTSKAPKQTASGTVTAPHGLIVRTRPSTVTGKVLRTLPKGTRVACYQKHGNWWRINPNKQEWVSSEWVK